MRHVSRLSIVRRSPGCCSRHVDLRPYRERMTEPPRPPGDGRPRSRPSDPTGNPTSARQRPVPPAHPRRRRRTAPAAHSVPAATARRPAPVPVATRPPPSLRCRWLPAARRCRGYPPPAPGRRLPARRAGGYPPGGGAPSTPTASSRATRPVATAPRRLRQQRRQDLGAGRPLRRRRRGVHQRRAARLRRPAGRLLAKGHQSPTVRAHAVAALNFQILWSIIGFALFFVSWCLLFIPSIAVFVFRDEKQELLGSLNIYSETAATSTRSTRDSFAAITSAAGQAISNAGRWQDSRDTVIQLETALRSRSDIDMAKGALIALHGCDPSAAFGRLVAESQRRNIKVRDLAVELLDHLQTPDGSWHRQRGQPISMRNPDLSDSIRSLAGCLLSESRREMVGETVLSAAIAIVGTATGIAFPAMISAPPATADPLPCTWCDTPNVQFFASPSGDISCQLDYRRGLHPICVLRFF